MPVERQKAVLLGHTGKLGQALVQAFGAHCQVEGYASQDLDASDPAQVEALLRRARPGLVLNAVACLGLDHCEAHPQRALALNTLLPRQLALLARELDFTLIHFGTDSVFPDRQGPGCFVESSPPQPLNLYGLTKLGGDCLVRALAPRHYVFRLPVMFGPSAKGGQLVERLLERFLAGQRPLRISADVLYCPSYSLDLAQEACRVWSQGLAWGLYHLANQGQASLYELVRSLLEILQEIWGQTWDLDQAVLPVSHHEFPALAVKNLVSPLGSEKLPPLRPWREALKAYARELAASQPRP